MLTTNAGKQEAKKDEKREDELHDGHGTQPRTWCQGRLGPAGKHLAQLVAMMRLVHEDVVKLGR